LSEGKQIDMNSFADIAQKQVINTLGSLHSQRSGKSLEENEMEILLSETAEEV
jgi:hypothetical protein